MSRLFPRLTKAGLTFAALAFAVAAMWQEEPPIHTFRVVLGVKDQTATKWNGKLSVSGGEILAIDGWRFEGTDKVLGTNGWECKTRSYIKPGKRFGVNLATGKPRIQPDMEIWPNGVTIRVKGANPTITLKLSKGKVKLVAQKINLGEPITALQGQVRIERLPDTKLARKAAPWRTPNAVQDDYPAFWIDRKTGKQYLAWVAYQKENDRILLAQRDSGTEPWSKPMIIAPKGHYFRVALAEAKNGTIWITYSAQTKNNWDLWARPLNGNKLGKAVQLTKDPGPDFWHRMTTDSRGRAWLVWQGFRNGQSDIFVTSVLNNKWQEPKLISNSKKNDWNPCVAADPTSDRIWIGWDAYQGSDYDVCFRSLSKGLTGKLDDIHYPGKEIGSQRFRAHISLACDGKGRLWAAWDEAGPQWGKDTGFLYGGQKRQDTSRLYASRSIRVACWSDNKWQEPTKAFATCLPESMQEYNEYPQLQADQKGRIWMAFRHRTCRRPREDGWAIQARWNGFTTAYLGDRWLSPIALPQSVGRNDMRIVSAEDSNGNIYLAYASDNRDWRTRGMTPRNHHVAVSRLDHAPAPKKMNLKSVEKENTPIAALCHPRETEQVDRIRNYKVEVGGRTYHIFRGDLHRHTDISTDGMGDGSLMDLHRYGIDAALFDYIMVGDHNMGNDNEYCWWRTQHSNDLYTVPGRFISMYGYERSVRYPNGHRNVIWTKRGHKTLPLPRPIPALQKRDTPNLYAYLRRTEGICTLHTSATSQGTDWKDAHDPELEPFVEIFQGYHTSYEAPKAPKTIDAETIRIHGKFEPAGFVSKALDKGYKLGFQASSDHISTHVSYACILAEKFSREGLVEAMKKRHTYGATDNIIMDVRMGNHLMGDSVTTRQPKLKVVILGTGPIDKVEVIRNGEAVHTVRPKLGVEEARFEWADANPPAERKTSYYYVRMLQRNGQMAWASPIWVSR